jgi:hypothetical protein
MDTSIVTYTFLFNIAAVIIFSIVYSSISPHNFEPLSPNDKLTYLDYLFYAVTSGKPIPDVTAVTDLAKFLALIQQLLLMGSAYILHLFSFQTPILK